MDALRPCPAAAAAACAFSTSGTSQSYRIFLPAGPRRSTALVLKMQSGSGISMAASSRQHGHAICARKSRHFNFELDPDDDHETSVAKFQYLKEHNMPPDEPFHEERVKIDGCFCKIRDNFPRSILYLHGRRLSLLLFLTAGDAVRLASEVMDCAALRHGSEDKIYLDTIKKTLGTYVSIIVSIVDDLSNKKVVRETFVLLLGSLGGIAAVSHVLLQDAMRSRDDAEVERARREYEQKMNGFKRKVITISLDDAYEIVMPTLEDAMRQTASFVILMIANRQKALDQVTGRTRAAGGADDGEPGGSATAVDSA